MKFENFSEVRWKRISEDYRKWWAGDLDRPLIAIRLHGSESEVDASGYPFLPKLGLYEDSIPADEIAGIIERNLSRQQFLGDAFPHAWLDFGPGVLAAFLGCNLGKGNGTIWFHPDTVKEIGELDFQVDESNFWVRRILDIIRATGSRLGDRVCLGNTDLGGVFDILSSFRPSENLIYDLYDEPEEVKRQRAAVTKCWKRFYTLLDDAICSSGLRGHSYWTPLFSDEPYAMIQSDFAYMIGPEQFNEFVLPELTELCSFLDNPFYHLDGIGELPHLDSLIGIERLKGIQWIPGDGQPDYRNWPEVYRKIHAGGKRIQLYCGGDHYNGIDVIAEQIGTAKGIVAIVDMDVDREAEALALLEKYGVAP